MATVITPLKNGERVTFEVPDQVQDWLSVKPRKAGQRLRFTTQDGRKWLVIRRACGLPHCLCDAEIREDPE